MADDNGNTGFDQRLHAYAASITEEALADLTSVATMIRKLYPHSDGGPADRASRTVRSAIRAVASLQRAMADVSARETGSEGPWKAEREERR